MNICFNKRKPHAFIVINKQRGKLNELSNDANTIFFGFDIYLHPPYVRKKYK